MNGVVLIPAYQRPEFLWHCLENIKRAHGADRYHYLFRFDHGHTPELYEVLKGFPLQHEVTTSPRSGYRIGKQSYNLLMGYKHAASMTNGLVLMVEEDVMVRQDFFLFHEAVHQARPDLFCSIAVANPNRRNIVSGPASEYYTSVGDYCSLGVAFRPQVIRDLIAPHATHDYFVNPVDYCRRHLKGTPIGDAFAEQDGLIRRIQWLRHPDKPIAWPWEPRAYHAGLYGCNRGNGPGGTFAKRLEYVTSIIYSDEAMRTFAKHPEWYEDSRPIALDAPAAPIELREAPINEATHPIRL